MSDLATLHRSTLRLPGEAPVKLSRLGAGKFCKAHSDGKRAILFTKDGNFDKAFLSELHRDNPDLPHLPAVEYLADTHDGTLYASPVYRKISKESTPEAWASWLLLKRATKIARAKLAEDRGTRKYDPRAGLHDGSAYNQYVLNACKECGVSGQLLAAVEALVDYAANYGAQVWVEFRPGNLGADEAGRLVLLDPTYDAEQLHKMT